MINIISIVIGVILIACAISLITSTYFNNKLAREMQDRTIWAFVKGGATITISDIETRQQGQSQTIGNTGFTTYRSNTMYRPIVAFTYNVNGVNYTGTKIIPGEYPFTNDKLSVLEFQNNFKVGMEKDFYYKLDTPSVASLLPEPTQSYVSTGSAMCCLIAIALLLFSGKIVPRPTLVMPLSTTSSASFGMALDL